MYYQILMTRDINYNIFILRPALCHSKTHRQPQLHVPTSQHEYNIENSQHYPNYINLCVKLNIFYIMSHLFYGEVEQKTMPVHIIVSTFY